MATFEKLKQFEPGREAKTVLLLLDVTEKVNRNGGSYCHLLLSDLITHSIRLFTK